jgi:hypothetical protein
VVDAGPPRQAAGKSFEFFCRDVPPARRFRCPWSNGPPARRSTLIEQVTVRVGGLYAYAMPRGSGKTSLAEAGALWATLYGYRQFPLLLGSDQGSALELLESIRTELECNDLLLADFPEVCYPIRRLEGIAHRANGQIFDGKRTHIHWSAEGIILPTIPGSPASGAIIASAGITGRVRGMKFKRPDGRSVRPDLCIPDDPQTDESARSPTQCAYREKILSGAVLGLAGPGRKIAVIMPCTVIAPGDMADRLLDRQKHPQWQGERTKLVYAWPKKDALWERYRQIRSEGLRAGDEGKAATDFYRANREAMDEGAAVAWPDRHNPDEVSAVQHAMNLRLDLGDVAFFAEYQNDPIDETAADDLLTADEIAGKLNGLPRGRIPIGRDHLTAFIDVQGKLLYWTVVAWGHGFNGDVIDYGTYPDQKRGHFTARDARRKLQDLVKGGGQEAAIHAGLEALTNDLLARRWTRDDGAEMSIERCLIDANWGESTDTVYQFCRATAHAAAVMPAHGKYVGASSRPWEQYTKKDGERLGHHWMLPSVKGKRAVRHVLTDVNYWKTFVHQRLAAPAGGDACLSLFGRKGERGPRSDDHRMFAEHLTAEYRVKTQGQGRTVDEWKPKPGKPDNHWFDCLVGCCVAASMLRVSLAERKQQKPTPKKVAVSFRAMQSSQRNKNGLITMAT